MPDGTIMTAHPQTRFEVRLSPSEALALAQIASGCGVTADEWIQKLVRANVMRQPQWFVDDVCGFRDVASALRQMMEINREPGQGTCAIGSLVLSKVVDSVIDRLDRSDDLNLVYWGATGTY